ncbi:transposase [Pseudomonas sp. BF-R-19]|uniref:transposase n=1 Tax=Pseudomonas sp. BF-R-19 TaxID=2832397 RepID=UPI001CC075D3|nr:transposase [Pseudomonas sp. BF-R-19]
MKFPSAVLLSCLIAMQMACTQTKDPMDDDAIPTNIPLPQVGVNQRPVVGEKKVLLVAAHWQDSNEIDMQKLYADTASEQPGSYSDYIRQSSMGKLTLKWTTITARFAKPYPGYSQVYLDAEEAARVQGYDPEEYDYLFVVENGPGGGQARMPGNKLFVRGSFQGYYIFAHEFGHNLGFNHGETYTKCPKDNDTVFAPDQCEITPARPATDTGDPVSQGRGLYPANYRWYAGWLDNSQVAVIERSGLYRLGVLGQTGPQLYLINRTGLTPSQIALEYRKPTHYDNFPPTDNRANGVWVRYTTMGSIVNNVQLDGTPETITTHDPTLQPGRTLKDDTAGIILHACTASADGATVAIAINGEDTPACPVAGKPLVAPEVLTPTPGAPATQNPVTFTGTSIPGAKITLNYAQDSENNGTEVAIADSTGNWRITLTPLTSGKYHSFAYQIVGDSASLLTGRFFEVAQ